MNTMLRSVAVAAVLAALPVAGTWAQSAAAGSGSLAKPTYPSGQNNDPALTGQRPSGTASVPASENPHVPGATGSTVVPGDNSTVSSNRRGTVQQKSGTTNTSGGGG
jgi:hypothetical protein